MRWYLKEVPELVKDKVYLSIDLKSFYASVECVERGLDPMTTNLVVADFSRTEKTICLAVTPSLKAYGISGRARLFEVVEKVGEVNAERRRNAPGRAFFGSSHDDPALKSTPGLALDYIVARPRMALYMKYSTRIYHIYLKYIAPEDIHVYSIDEVLIDASAYLDTYHLTARELASKMILDVLRTTGIPAAAGIGTNLYLSKVAMDVQAKHIPADENGLRIAELDEMSYRRLLWSHRPLTDFWRVGRGYAKKLEAHGLFTMGDIARCSLGKPGDFFNEDFLYRLFGINAELLIDHAWGWEPCKMADIKAYRPGTNSVGSGQVLHSAYPFEKAKLVALEMADLLALDLVDKKRVTDQLVLSVGYDIENMTDPVIRKAYRGEIVTDGYGRAVPKPAHGSANLGRQTASARLFLEAVTKLFERVVDKNLLVRRLNIAANHVVDEASAQKKDVAEQLDFFTDYAAVNARKEAEEATLAREKRMQVAMLSIKKKHGKNAVLRGMNLEDGATAVDRNRQSGGHKS
jgi:DNA polymerase V